MIFQVVSVFTLSFFAYKLGLYFSLIRSFQKAIVFLSFSAIVFFMTLIRFSKELDVSSPALHFFLILQILFPVLLILLVNKLMLVDKEKNLSAFAIISILVLLGACIVFLITDIRFISHMPVFVTFVFSWFFICSKKPEYLIIPILFFITHIYCLAVGVHLQGLDSQPLSVVGLFSFLLIVPVCLKIKFLCDVFWKETPNNKDKKLQRARNFYIGTKQDFFLFVFLLFATGLQFRFMFK